MDTTCILLTPSLNLLLNIVSSSYVFPHIPHMYYSHVMSVSLAHLPMPVWIMITKDNLLLYYYKAWTVALKPTTIKSAFRKTRIHPFDHNTIPLSAFEPAKNTTTQAPQPLPAQLPSILVPTPPATSAATTLTPNMMPATSAAPSSTSLDLDVGPGSMEALTHTPRRECCIVRHHHSCSNGARASLCSNEIDGPGEWAIASEGIPLAAGLRSIFFLGVTISRWFSTWWGPHCIATHDIDQ